MHLRLLTSVAALSAGVTATSVVPDLATDKVLRDAAPIFGEYHNSTSLKANWMRDYADDTPITSMNLPGAHDASTWNYTEETSHSLKHLNRINDAGILFPSAFYRCQSSPLIDMLNGGVRVFDLRFAFDVTNSTLVFYHGNALQSETATVEGVLFGFYQWLDDHPTEALFLSFKDEGGTAKYVPNSATTQRSIYNLLTSDHARRYFVQSKDVLGKLGDSRGKITLFRRFGLDKIEGAELPGISFPGNQWKDNSDDFALVYNSERNLTAYIEDYYNIGGSVNWQTLIEKKYNATSAHLRKALEYKYSDSLFWTFASAGADGVGLFPEVMALGAFGKSGVNQRLLSFLKEHKGGRLGIVMYDFYQEDDGIVDALLSVDSNLETHYDF